MIRAFGKRRRGEGAFGLIVGLALLVVAIIAGVKIVPLHVHGNEVKDAMNEQANFGTYLTPDKIQWNVFQKAQEAGVPLPLKEIIVRRESSNIVIEAKYSQEVTVLGYKYKYDFDQKVVKPVF